MLEVKIQWNGIIKELKEKNWQAGTLYSIEMK